MDSADIKEQIKMTYAEQVSYLLRKYGPAKHDYFCSESCKTKNAKTLREKEGLTCHHVDEDKAILLDHPLYAAKNPFAYQRADRLVYANLLEHYLLQVKISEEPRTPDANAHELLGIGEITETLAPRLNDFYNGCPSSSVALHLVKDNFEDYVNVVRQFWSFIQNDQKYGKLFTKEHLCVGRGNVPYENLLLLLQ